MQKPGAFLLNTITERMKCIKNYLRSTEIWLKEIQDLTEVGTPAYYKCASLRADIQKIQIQVTELKSLVVK